MFLRPIQENQRSGESGYETSFICSATFYYGPACSLWRRWHQQHALPDPESDFNPDSDTDANSDANSDAVTNAFTHAYAYADTHADTHASAASTGATWKHLPARWGPDLRGDLIDHDLCGQHAVREPGVR